MEETQKKKGNTWLIVLLFLIILGLIGYIAYDKVLTASQNETKRSGNVVEKKDITTQTKATTLHNTLITGEHYYDNTGLYYKEKITPNKGDDERFIRFALASYFNEKGINFPNKVCGEPSDETGVFVTKDEFNNYVNQKYNTTIKYDLPVKNDSYYLNSFNYFMSHESKWAIYCNGTEYDQVYSEMTKAEQEGDYIYIYDTATFCGTNDLFYRCYPYINDHVNNTEENPLITCSKCTDSNCINDEACPTGDNYNLEDVANILLEKNPEKLLKYKHTFKKQDGNYYWVSSEVEQ